MKRLLIAAVLTFGLSTSTVELASGALCVGATACRACKNCKYCAHCAKKGGTCGVCKKK